MSRTNIDIDDELIDGVMRQYGLKSKKEAVDFALRQLYTVPLSLEEALALRGTNFWDGDPVAAELDPAEFPELFAGRTA
jgi:Arc/MetJ family transcription regulator